MQSTSSRPNLNKLSTLTATVLLVYALTQFIRVPLGIIPIQLPGFFIPISLQFSNLIWLGVAVIASTGMDWLMSDRMPEKVIDRFQHWLLPALTAWVIGIPLYSLDPGPTWWLIFMLGGLLLTFVFLAEYYSIEPNSAYSTPAAIGLTAVSYTLFLILTASIRFSSVRLYLETPVIIIGAVIISLRVLHLLLGGSWHVGWSIAVGLIVGQIAIGLYYLPVTPLQFGLLLTGMLYASLLLANRTIKQSIQRTDLIEAGSAIVLAAVLAFLIG